MKSTPGKQNDLAVCVLGEGDRVSCLRVVKAEHDVLYQCHKILNNSCFNLVFYLFLGC